MKSTKTHTRFVWAAGDFTVTQPENQRPNNGEVTAMNQAAHHSVVETTKQIVRNMDPVLKQTRKMKDAVDLSTLAINEQVKVENSRQASPSDKARVAKLHRIAANALQFVGAVGAVRWHLGRADEIVENGGPGSGDFGHMGRPGKRGGSASEGEREDARSSSSGLHPTRSDAIADYVGNGYESLNKGLRSGKITPSVEKRTSILRQCATPLPKSATLFRGAALPNEVASKLRVGAIFRDKGFVSTSRSAATAKDRLTYYGRPRKTVVLFNIEAPKGTKAVDVPKLIGDSQFEKEVILMPNSRFKVKSVRSAKRFGDPYTECTVQYLPYGG